MYGGMQTIQQPYFSITVKGSDMDKKEQFRELVEKTLADLAKNGLDHRSLLAGINSDEFKYVMQKLEFEITNAANNDKFEIGFNFHAMEDQHGNWQSSDFFDAIASELQANGYIFNCMKYSPTTSNLNIIIGWYKETT